MVCYLLSNGVSQLHSTRDLQTMSFLFTFQFAKLIVSYQKESISISHYGEQLTLNQWVLGSSPRWCTKKSQQQKLLALF